MKTVKTSAIVLRRTNYSEADRILQLLTPLGKKSVMAKGVRKEKSRLSGGIELFAICDVVIGDGKGSLATLISSRLVVFFKNIMQDYDRLQFAYLVVKLISNASEMIDEPEWYDVLSETLAGLDNLNLDFRLIQAWFYLQYCILLGYELPLYRDVAGDKILADLKYSYDVSDRGLRVSQDGNVSTDHIKLVRLISTKPLKVLTQIGGIDKVVGDCMMLAKEHASIHITL